MTRLHFQHLRETDNIGDKSCAPYDYFAWDNATVSDIRHDNTPDYDVGIYGGGKIFGGLSHYAGVRRAPGQVNIAWGVGTVQSFPISLRYWKARRRMDLVGSRDWGDTRYEYAPCPSCMHPAFDAPPAPEHEVVFYAHAGKTGKMKLDVPSDIPTIDNNCASLDEALRFIASGATVISNSYHGVYWGLLMGRKTLCVPFSNKFAHYRKAPTLTTPDNWAQDLPHAQAHPEMLDLCRTSTTAFKTKVDQMIADFDPS